MCTAFSNGLSFFIRSRSRLSPVFIIVYLIKVMRKAEDLKYGRFVERICQCNFSITFESSMLQKMYKISRENGPDSE
jgi:hypothetical protein